MRRDRRSTSLNIDRRRKRSTNLRKNEQWHNIGQAFLGAARHEMD